MMFSWLRHLISKRTDNQADNSGVVVGRDNFGTIITGPVLGTVNINKEVSSQTPGYDKQQIDDIIKRITIAARELVVSAQHVMQFSSTVVPVDLDIVPDDTQFPSEATNLEEILQRASSGESLFFFGEGGIGKTTAVLELARRMLDGESPRIPIFIDAAVWSASKHLMLEHVVSLPSFVAQEITLIYLAKTLSTNRITFIINGWNEIPTKDQDSCAQKMKQVTGTTLNVNFILTAREAFDKAGLVSPIKVRVKGLSWSHRKKFIRSELEEAGQATQLIERLARNKALRIAARNPLILTGIVRLQRHGIETNWGGFNIFKAIVDDYEKEGTRHKSLLAPPLGGMHTQYLEMLACEMNRKQSSILDVNEAQAELTKLIQQFVSEGQLDIPPSSQDVLQVLCNHHLLFADGNFVRFAHQRFQEYFVASHLMTLLTNTNHPVTPQNTLLVEAINWPFWEDALFLVAEKLTEDSVLLVPKVTLIEAARRIDLCIACRLAGVVGLQRVDDVKLFESLVNIILQLSHSPVNKVKEFATTCMIDTGFDVFANYLWSQLVSEDKQVRLDLYRLGHSSISIKQLGPTTKQRIMTWPTERRAEFVTEVANNPENIEFLEELASQDESDNVKAAAIAAIAWDFPASEFALGAWKLASDEVKQDPCVLNLLNESLLEAGEDVRMELIRLSNNASDDKRYLSLALSFPDWLGEMTSDVLLRTLSQKNPEYSSHDPVVPLARKVATERFLSLAKELFLTRKIAPDWAREAIVELHSQERSALFQNAWDSINYGEEPKFDIKVIGACATRRQVHALLLELLNLHNKQRTEKLEPKNQTQYNTIEKILTRVPVENLVYVALELGQEVEYFQAQRTIDILSYRVLHGDDYSEEKTTCSLSSGQMDSLIQAFWKKIDEQEQPQNKIQIDLCSLASYVNASHYSKHILECCRMQLDAWTKYGHALDVQRSAGKQAPPNPYYDRYITDAIVRCGFGVLPNLLELIEHPHAHEFVFDAIARILAQPWNARQQKKFLSPNMNGENAKKRREANLVMLQPDPTLQAETDRVARKLVVHLRKNLQALDTHKNGAISSRQTRYTSHPDGSLLVTLASIPSRECLLPIWDALARDDISEGLLLSVIEALVNQGVLIDDKRVIQRMQFHLEKYTSTKWVHESDSWRPDGLNKFLYFILPISLLDKQLTDYLPGWIHYCHNYGVLRSLKVLCVDEAWYSLAYLARTADITLNFNEELADAIVKNLSSSTFELFLELLKDGTFFRIEPNNWRLKQMSGRIADVIGNDAHRQEALVEICSQSGTEAAETLAFAVLFSIKGNEQELLNFGLRVLDNNSHKTNQHHIIDIMRGFFSPFYASYNYGPYRFHPRFCGKLRKELFSRALGTDQSSNIAKMLLSEIEASRREFEYPPDEPRHPNIDKLVMPWNKALDHNLSNIM